MLDLFLIVILVVLLALTSATVYYSKNAADTSSKSLVVSSSLRGEAKPEPTEASGTESNGLPRVIFPQDDISGTVRDYLNKDPNWMHGIAFDGDKMLPMIDEVVNIFDSFGVVTYNANGTALGLVRDKKLLEWDHDWDLNASIHDFFTIQKEVVPALFRAGYKILEVVPLSACPFLYSENYMHDPGDAKRLLFIKDGQMFDVAFQVWMPPLETTDAYGRTFMVPKDVGKYLEDVYGADWETPRSDYVIGERADKEGDPKMLLARPYVGGMYHTHIMS